MQELIENAPDPTRRKYLAPNTWKQNWREEDTREHLAAGVKKLRLVKLAFAVDLCLAFETDTVDKFVTVTAADEQALWATLTGNMLALCEKMETEHAKDIRSLTEAICGYCDALRAMNISEHTPVLPNA